MNKTGLIAKISIKLICFVDMYLEIIISDGFRGISRFFGNFVGFRGNT